MARKRGRPAFAPTPAMRRQVEQCIAAGMTQDAIARAIGCDPKTMAKHFPDELATGLAKKRAEAIALLWKAAKGKKPNVAAVKKLIELHAITEAAAAAGDPEAPAAVPNTGKLGKKVLARIAATQVGGEGSEWGDDLEPPAGTLVN
jgi:hypothetical protein